MNSEQRQCLAIIPARGGSKGVPRKNVKDLAGKPLLAHAILAARAAPSISRVVVSTDDAEIAQVAVQWGAEALARPADISGDKASSEAALLHALEELEKREGYKPELVMLIQCTSPLTSGEDLEGLIQTLRDKGADSAFTAAPFYHFLWRREADESAAGINHSGKKRKRRQDLEPQFLENGAAYVMRTALFQSTQDRFCGRVVLHATAPERCLEIDDPADFVKAEAVMRHGVTVALGDALPAEVAALVLDFDGVLTDNRVYVDETGRESVACNRGDGMGLTMLRRTQVRTLILSKEQNPVVSARARKLQIECLQGIDDKPAALQRWLESHALDARNIIYVGNDVNDLECMRLVGCALAPSDAHPAALAAATFVLGKPGGHGAVREVCDAILARSPSRDAAR
jgi:YrbI family 3-deoxy-D-manno-octulosonate 8-phosphate phosphatase